MNTQITKTEAAAYTKGWESQAKSLDGAIKGAIKKFGEDSPLVNFFEDGYRDKELGRAKWSCYGQQDTGTEVVEVDGTKVAEVDHVNLDDGLAAEAAEIDQDPEDEESSTEDATEPQAPSLGAGASIPTLLDAAKDKSLAKEERQALRAEISVKKNHYKMGWNSAVSPLFKGFDDAQAGYLKRRPGSVYLEDWNRGYEDRVNGAEFGQLWKATVSDKAKADLHKEIDGQ